MTSGLRLGFALAAMGGVAGASARAQDAAPAASLAIVEFLSVDASPAPDAEAMRALLARSGMSAEAWLASELAASGRYRTVDQSRVGAALRANGMTASDCQDVPCLVQLGRALEVDRVVAGQVSKFSNLIWFLYAVMVDVRAGRIQQREEFELKGDITVLLPRGMRSLARRLIEHDRGTWMASALNHAVPAPPPQSVRLTRDEVLATLARATEQAGADFSGRDLSGLDLTGIDFKRANLSRCRLVGSNLAGGRLFAVTLSDAVATDADFSGTNLDVAVMYRIDLSRTNLRNASLYGTILTGANFTDADLTHARIISAAPNTRFTRAKLTHANFGADPANQPMGVMRTDLTNADLSGADLTGANLRKANLTRADLTGADLTDADVTWADFHGAILRSVRGWDRIRGLGQAKNVDQAVLQD